MKIKTQTIIILPKLTAMLAAPVCDIPNQKDFRLAGILKTSGIAIPLTVAKDSNGCHYLIDENKSHRSTSIFSGWVKDTTETIKP